MEQRDIEIFLTLADELHFGRAAERLHVSTAWLSAGETARIRAFEQAAATLATAGGT